METLSRDVKHTTSLDTICQECDYITLHVPAVDSTKGMINKAAIDQMKDGVVILNFARDVLANEDDLAEALKSGKVKKYVTDFANPKSVAMEHTIVIPHLGASTEGVGGQLREDGSPGDHGLSGKRQHPQFRELSGLRYGREEDGLPRSGITYEHSEHDRPDYRSAGGGKINISDMTNKSRDKFAYTLMDLEHTPPDDIMVQKLNAIEGVLRVRLI